MNAPALTLDWRKRIAPWLERFDARPLRERVLMGLAAAALAFMLADALWLTPATRAWRSAHAAEQQAQAALDTLRADVQRLQSMHQDQARAEQAELAAWRERVRAGDADLRAQQAALVGPDRMVELLQQLLAGHARVRVRSMQSLPRTDLLADGQAAAPDAKALPSLYRHGVELTLEGGYADLVDYLRALEALPQRLLWGSVAFKVEQHPKAVLTLRLYTLSLERQWLEI